MAFFARMKQCGTGAYFGGHFEFQNYPSNAVCISGSQEDKIVTLFCFHCSFRRTTVCFSLLPSSIYPAKAWKKLANSLAVVSSILSCSSNHRRGSIFHLLNPLSLQLGDLNPHMFASFISIRRFVFILQWVMQVTVFMDLLSSNLRQF